jgi:hypothetical protein
MIGLFKRTPAPASPDTAALGTSALASRMPSGAVVPSGCVGVVCNKGGATRRIDPGARLLLSEHESAFCFHPGPYSAELTPFAAAPELGLHLSFAIDGADPRVAQQRFDLYLASEGGDGVQLAAFAGAVEDALQRELVQGNLALPPCTSIDEWNLFRAGLNQLLYQRFGMTVDDCVPVDLGERVDYAQLLRAREVGAATPPAAAAIPAQAPPSDAQALRRLFLELPSVTSALRLVTPEPGKGLFRQQQQLLQRLDQITLLFETMPALAWAAPGVPLDAACQAARAGHSVQALRALDEAWALLARMGNASAALFDEADRILANLELHAAGRRAAA